MEEQEEYLYHPEGSNTSWYRFDDCKKRDYDMLFDFQNYTKYYSRYQYIHPKSKLKFNISVGEYLAGDQGYTFKVGRRFANGIEFIGFFTKTDVSPELFGEGSFDKGIEIIIPIDNFFRRKDTLGKISWRPLTKDPGALIIKAVDLADKLNNFRVY